MSSNNKSNIAIVIFSASLLFSMQAGFGADAVPIPDNFFVDGSTQGKKTPENGLRGNNNGDNDQTDIEQMDVNQNADVKNNEKVANDRSIIVVNQRLKSLLEEYARIQNIDIIISDKVKNRLIRSEHFPIERDKFFAQISANYSLDYYRRGDEYFISDISERTSRMISLKNLKFEDVRAELSSLVSNDEDFTFEEVSASNSIFVSAPPSYIALVELVTEGMLKNNLVDSVTLVRFGVKTKSNTTPTD